MEMIQSGWVELAARTGVNFDHEGVVIYKIEMRFIVFFGIFSSAVFCIFRYLEYRLRYRYRYRYRLPTQD